MVDKGFLLRVKGYGLTTAEIHYHIPEHPRLLQLFVWQEYDVAPDNFEADVVAFIAQLLGAALIEPV